MRIFYSFFLSSILLLAGASGGYAQRLECTFKTTQGSWVPEFLIVQQSGKSLLAADPIMLHYHKKPIAVRITTNNKRKKVLEWRFETTTGSQSTMMLYRLVLTKDDKGTAWIHATPRGFRNNFRGKGSCVEKPIDPNFQKQFDKILKEKLKNG